MEKYTVKETDEVKMSIEMFEWFVELIRTKYNGKECNEYSTLDSNVIKKPIYFLSDTHGSKFVWKWLMTLPKSNNHNDCIYVLLGDMVDRGCYSLVNLVTFFLFKFMHPEKFYLVRGNHEEYRTNLSSHRDFKMDIDHKCNYQFSQIEA